MRRSEGLVSNSIYGESFLCQCSRQPLFERKFHGRCNRTKSLAPNSGTVKEAPEAVECPEMTLYSFFLSRFTRLTSLYLDHNHLATCRGLGGLESLQILTLDGNRITDTWGLARLTSLTSLDLSRNRIQKLQVSSQLCFACFARGLERCP